MEPLGLKRYIEQILRSITCRRMKLMALSSSPSTRSATMRPSDRCMEMGVFTSMYLGLNAEKAQHRHTLLENMQ